MYLLKTKNNSWTTWKRKLLCNGYMASLNKTIPNVDISGRMNRSKSSVHQKFLKSYNIQQTWLQLVF